MLLPQVPVQEVTKGVCQAFFTGSGKRQCASWSDVVDQASAISL
jgi:hypothetical protein